MCSVQSAGTHDVVMQRINQLKEMVAAGIIKKEELPGMIKAIYLGSSGGPSPSSPPEPEEKNVTKVLRESSRPFRRPASPETRRIRNMIEAPIVRRFELQCATPDSVLFGKVPPKRLDEGVFNIACEDPLEEIYINNAKELSKVPSAKVISIIKWKVRKMRGNLVKKGVAKEGFYHDDGFNWDAVQKLAPRKLQFKATPNRGFVRVKREPTRKRKKVIEIDNDEDTPSDPEMRTPPKKTAEVPKRKCGKCGREVSVPYPLEMDWTTNTSAVAYCKKCFSSVEKQCEELALKPKAKTSDRRSATVNAPKSQVCFIIFFDLVLFSLLFNRCFSTPPLCLLMKFCSIRLLLVPPDPETKKEEAQEEQESQCDSEHTQEQGMY